MQNSEKISALLDDAGEDGDLAALGDIARDPAARQTWARYRLIGDTLREPGGFIPPPQDFTARVTAALAHEAPLQKTGAAVIELRTRRRWRPRAAVGLAAAASLAALAFLGVNTPTPSNLSSAPVAQQSPVAAPVLLATEAAADPDQVSVLSPQEYQRRINSYLVNFNEQRAQMGVPGVHPYVRVVGFESAREP